MPDWLPVVGTLAGAIVAGGISFFLHSASNRHAIRLLRTNLFEDRARWAAEHELNRIQKFHGTIEQLIDAVINFRISTAWDARKGKTPPSWILPKKDAREGVENSLQSAYSEISLLGADIRSDFRQSTEQYRNCFLADTSEEWIVHLMQLERDLVNFKKSLGERYRKVFDARRSGSDLISSE